MRQLSVQLLPYLFLLGLPWIQGELIQTDGCPPHLRLCNDECLARTTNHTAPCHVGPWGKCLSENFPFYCNLTDTCIGKDQMCGDLCFDGILGPFWYDHTSNAINEKYGKMSNLWKLEDDIVYDKQDTFPFSSFVTNKWLERYNCDGKCITPFEPCNGGCNHPEHLLRSGSLANPTSSIPLELVKCGKTCKEPFYVRELHDCGDECLPKYKPCNGTCTDSRFQWLCGNECRPDSSDSRQISAWNKPHLQMRQVCPDGTCRHKDMNCEGPLPGTCPDGLLLCRHRVNSLRKTDFSCWPSSDYYICNEIRNDTGYRVDRKHKDDWCFKKHEPCEGECIPGYVKCRDKWEWGGYKCKNATEYIQCGDECLKSADYFICEGTCKRSTEMCNGVCTDGFEKCGKGCVRVTENSNVDCNGECQRPERLCNGECPKPGWFKAMEINNLRMSTQLDDDICKPGHLKDRYHECNGIFLEYFLPCNGTCVQQYEGENRRLCRGGRCLTESESWECDGECIEGGSYGDHCNGVCEKSGYVPCGKSCLPGYYKSGLQSGRYYSCGDQCISDGFGRVHNPCNGTCREGQVLCGDQCIYETLYAEKDFTHKPCNGTCLLGEVLCGDKCVVGRIPCGGECNEDHPFKCITPDINQTINSLTVSWDTIDCPCVRKYEVSICKPDQEDCEAVEVSAGHHPTISHNGENLDQCTEYVIKIKPIYEGIELDDKTIVINSPIVDSGAEVAGEGGQGVKVFWSPVTCATAYKVYRMQEEEKSEWEEVATSEGTIWMGVGVPCAKYQYGVSVLIDDSESEIKAVGDPIETPLDEREVYEPPNLEIMPEDDHVVVTFDHASCISRYDFNICEEELGEKFCAPGEYIPEEGEHNITFTSDILDPCTNYYLEISPTNDGIVYRSVKKSFTTAAPGGNGQPGAPGSCAPGSAEGEPRGRPGLTEDDIDGEVGEGWGWDVYSIAELPGSIYADDSSKCCEECKKTHPTTEIWEFFNLDNMCFCYKTTAGKRPKSIREDSYFSNGICNGPASGGHGAGSDPRGHGVRDDPRGHGAGGDLTDLLPQSVDPYPVDPYPVDPYPVDPYPVDPYPVGPYPGDPYPVDPYPVDPYPVGPYPVDPYPNQRRASLFEAKLGGNAELQCFMVGNVGNVDARWRRKDGRPLPSRHSQRGGNRLYLVSVDRYDATVYTCEGTDSRGQSIFQADTRVTVTDPPRVTLDPPSQTVQSGDNPQIICTATGDAPIRIEWTRERGDLSWYVTQDNQGNRKYRTLQFPSISSNDAGRYICKATNAAGVAESVADIIVNDPRPGPGNGHQEVENESVCGIDNRVYINNSMAFSMGIQVRCSSFTSHDDLTCTCDQQGLTEDDIDGEVGEGWVWDRNSIDGLSSVDGADSSKCCEECKKTQPTTEIWEFNNLNSFCFCYKTTAGKRPTSILLLSHLSNGICNGPASGGHGAGSDPIGHGARDESRDHGAGSDPRSHGAGEEWIVIEPDLNGGFMPPPGFELVDIGPHNIQEHAQNIGPLIMADPSLPSRVTQGTAKIARKETFGASDESKPSCGLVNNVQRNAGDTWTDDCNYCICGENGIFSCTKRFCGNIPVININPRPGDGNREGPRPGPGIGNEPVCGIDNRVYISGRDAFSKGIQVRCSSFTPHDDQTCTCDQQGSAEGEPRGRPGLTEDDIDGEVGEAWVWDPNSIAGLPPPVYGADSSKCCEECKKSEPTTEIWQFNTLLGFCNCYKTTAGKRPTSILGLSHLSNGICKTFGANDKSEPSCGIVNNWQRNVGDTWIDDCNYCVCGENGITSCKKRFCDNITVIKDVSHSPPEIKIKPTALGPVYLGDFIDVRCLVTGAPRSTTLISWSKVGGSLANNVKTTKHLLRFDSVIQENAGKYVCTVETSGGRYTEYYDLIVMG